MPMKTKLREVTPEEAIQKLIMEKFDAIPEMKQLREGFRRRADLVEKFSEEFLGVAFLTLWELERCRAENGLLKIAMLLNEEIFRTGNVLTIYDSRDETTFTADCFHVVNTGTDEDWCYTIQGFCQASQRWVEIDEKRHRFLGTDGEVVIPDEFKCW